MLKLSTIHSARTPSLLCKPTQGFQRSFRSHFLASSLPSFCPLSEWECLCFSLKHISTSPGGLLPSQRAYISFHRHHRGPGSQSVTFLAGATGRPLPTFPGKDALEGCLRIRGVSEAHLGIKLSNCHHILRRSHGAVLSLSLLRLLLSFLHLPDRRLPRDRGSHRPRR